MRRRPFDVELICAPGEIEASLEALKAAGYSAQSLRLDGEPADLSAAEEIAQRHRVQLNLRTVKLPENAILDT